MLQAGRQYQAKLGGNPGDVVVDIEELEQALRIVLGTPLGSIPGDPNFGNRLHEYVDEDSVTAKPLIVREISRAVAACEPRIWIASVTPLGVTEEGKLENEIEWRPASLPKRRELQRTRVTT